MSQKQSKGEQRILVESLTVDIWAACFKGREQDPCYGQSPRDAVQSLLNANPDCGLSLGDLVENPASRRKNRIECLARERIVCPDCRGSGKYIGFTVIEPCRACHGSGRRIPPRIDVVKSSKIFSALLRVMLKKFGHEYTVRGFDDPAEYFDQLVAEPDCIITGIMLKGMHGIEFLSHVSRLGIQAPVIVETSCGEYEYEALEHGAFAFLHYDHYEPQFLVRTVERAIASGPAPAE